MSNASSLASLLKVAPVGVYSCDRDGLITYFNQVAAEVWGRTPKLNDPAHRYCGSFKMLWPDTQPMPHETCWMARALQEKREYNRGEVLVEQPDGQRIPVVTYAHPVFDDSGQLQGAINIVIQIEPEPRRGGSIVPTRSRVLLIGGSDTQTENFEFLLTALDYNVKIVPTGVEAIQTAKAFRPKIIFVPLVLPQMDGREVARMIRRAPWGHNVLLVAVNNNGPEHSQGSRAAGFDHEIEKSLNHAAVLPILASIDK